MVDKHCQTELTHVNFHRGQSSAHSTGFRRWPTEGWRVNSKIVDNWLHVYDIFFTLIFINTVTSSIWWDPLWGIWEPLVCSSGYINPKGRFPHGTVRICKARIHWNNQQEAASPDDVLSPPFPSGCNLNSSCTARMQKPLTFAQTNLFPVCHSNLLSIISWPLSSIWREIRNDASHTRLGPSRRKGMPCWT